MIIFGWGRTTKEFMGKVFEKMCPHCNKTDFWQLCIIRTWFTLFFIPVIPYKSMYCVTCPSCGSYIELTQEQFEKMKTELQTGVPMEAGNPDKNSIPDSLKYAGKTEAQINYLKQMEEYNNR